MPSPLPRWIPRPRRSLRRRRRPSPLLWRVGNHISDFGACSVFTARCSPRGSLTPFQEPFLGVLQLMSSPREPLRVLPAGATVCRPGLPPGGGVHLGKAHTTTTSESAPPLRVPLHSSSGWWTWCTGGLPKTPSSRLPVPCRPWRSAAAGKVAKAVADSGALPTQEQPPETNAESCALTASDAFSPASTEPHQAFADGGARMNGLKRVPGGGIEPPTRGSSGQMSKGQGPDFTLCFREQEPRGSRTVADCAAVSEEQDANAAKVGHTPRSPFRDCTHPAASR